MHSNLSDHNNLSKSMNCELSALEILGSKLGLSTDSALDDQEKTGNKKPSALEILGSKLGLSTDSALDDQEKTGNKKPEVAIIRVKDSHKARKKKVRIAECGEDESYSQSKLCTFVLGTLCLSCSCKFHSIFTAEDFDCCPF